MGIDAVLLDADGVVQRPLAERRVAWLGVLGRQEDLDGFVAAVLSKDDDSPRARDFETLFWAVTAGLKLFDDSKNQKSEAQNLKTDFRRALGNKYVEIPGGLGTVKFEVIKHREPAWWQKVFRFLDSNGGRSLISALGFPAVTQQVVRFIDEAASRLDGSGPEVLYASRPMRLAFSKQARDAYTGGGPVRIGSLNPGTWVLARGRDFKTLLSNPAYYLATYGRLVPRNVSMETFLSGKYSDPFQNLTYAVFRTVMKSVRLDFTLN